jgi:integrase
MAQVNQRLWRLPGQRTKRKAWDFTAQINGKQVRRYKAEWTQDDAEAELAKALLQIEPEKPKGAGITLAQAAERYAASKARKRTIEADRRQLDLLKAEFGGETPLAEITASRISEYKTKRLASVRKIDEGEAAVAREVPLNSESYDALVTLNPKASGRVFRTKSVRKAYENAVTNAQLDDVNFHALRHTFASWAVMRGVSLKELQELLGHSSLAMTMRYAHLAPERLRSAVARLEGLTSSKPTEESAQTSTQDAYSPEGVLPNSA